MPYPRKDVRLIDDDGNSLVTTGGLQVVGGDQTVEHVFAWLLNGASRDMTVNGSVTPVVFEWENDTGYTVWINRMLIYYSDSGTFDATLYGNGVSLSTGIEFKHVTAVDATIIDLMDGFPVKSNAQWQAMCYDWSYNAIGTGDNTASVRWTFGNAGKALQIASGEKLQMTINDDLTGLTEHFAQVQGYYTT